MEEPDRIRLGIVGAEGIGADELGEALGLVGVGAAEGPHLVEDDRNAGLRDLPGCLRSREAAADDVNGLGRAHAPPLAGVRSAINRFAAAGFKSKRPPKRARA